MNGTSGPSPRPGSVLVKALALFVVLNALFAAVDPLPWMARASAYNVVWPGRARLPYADNPERAHSLTLDSLDAMFASHEVARNKPAGEYRVLLMGDSATWGWLLRPEETLAGQLNRLAMRAPDGRSMRFYNLGYPIMSAAKDVLLLNRALAYQPDLVVWVVTLESLPRDKQFVHPLLQANAAEWDALAGADAGGPPPRNRRCVAPAAIRRVVGGNRGGSRLSSRIRARADRP